MKIGTAIALKDGRQEQEIELVLTRRLSMLLDKQATDQAALKARYASRFPSPKV